MPEVTEWFADQFPRLDWDDVFGDPIDWQTALVRIAVRLAVADSDNLTWEQVFAD